MTTNVAVIILRTSQLYCYEYRGYNITIVAGMTTNVRPEIFETPFFFDYHVFLGFLVPPNFADVPLFPDSMNFSKFPDLLGTSKNFGCPIISR